MTAMRACVICEAGAPRNAERWPLMKKKLTAALRVASDLDLPLDLVTQTIGILANPTRCSRLNLRCCRTRCIPAA
jgi:hypothetical protein